MADKKSKVKKLAQPSKRELANDFYPMFLRLMQNGLEIEAYLLILSTWNISRFKFVVTDFNLVKFKEQIKRLEPLFNKFKRTDFRTINFDEYSVEIKKIFRTLSAIKGVEKTGASKIMHLKVPETFVMWDDKIRHNYDCSSKEDGQDHLEFLKKMQELYGHMKDKSGRTLAKRIDEHNYATITEPALNKAKRSRQALSRS